jgi:hypothetical protein
LLFGVLALQADFLDAAQFAEACSAWAGRKDTPLADLLVERGLLIAEQRGFVDLLLRQKLNKHGGDAHASLAGALATPDVRSVLESVADDDVQQSLAGLKTNTTPRSCCTDGQRILTNAHLIVYAKQIYVEPYQSSDQADRPVPAHRPARRGRHGRSLSCRASHA